MSPTRDELMGAALHAIQQKFPDSSGWQILKIQPHKKGYKAHFKVGNMMDILGAVIGDEKGMGRVRTIQFEL
jgi:hypothetical protein